MTTLSLAFSLRLSSVTRTVAVAPAGIVAPFEPVTDSLTRAVKVSPTLCVLVHTRVLDARLIVVPAAIVPTEPPLAAPPVLLTVFPLAVVLDGRVVDLVGVVVVVRGV